MQAIEIINATMELADCKDKWFFDEKYGCWCLEDVLYTEKAVTPKFQRLSIFVPAPYMSAPGVVAPEGEMNGYTAGTAPVIFENNSAGYAQMPHVWLGGPRCYAVPYLAHGLVYVTAGNRGRDSKDAQGEFSGKSPWNLVDLKTAIRFLRHNAAVLPGDLNKIISIGWSAGGAMSSLLAATGNNERYLPYLEQNGAFMDERDDVYGAQIYCPITDLEHADLAYEWMFHADSENEDSPAGPGGRMDGYQRALSDALLKKYVAYFNGLGLKHPVTGEALALGEDGRSGSGYDYLMEKLNESATKFLRKLSAGELKETYSVQDYLTGNYTYLANLPHRKGGPDGADAAQHHAGPGVAMQRGPVGGPDGKPGERPTMGDMLSRPPKGVPYQGFEPPMGPKQGADKTAWLKWDGERATVTDLDSYVLNHRRRMKPCTSFDTLSGTSGENSVFGTVGQEFSRFDFTLAEVITELKEQFPEEYAKCAPSFEAAKADEALAERIYLYNPLNYIGTGEAADQAPHVRIRVGACDADTSFTVSMVLALKLANAGKDVDYALVWDQPHSEADYPGEICQWIDRICR